ncbi:MAG TPA: glycosyltransferase 87 family protein [Candidatus Limnocylindria bacterium]|nr:glycosyltransferase 87 family protein [Candidatus Limnocylindria bacterium]
MIARALERAGRGVLETWRALSIDARAVAGIGLFNWLLLFANHTTVAATRDLPLWRLFPQGGDAVFLFSCGVLAAAYALRDLRSGAAFTTRQRAIHLAAIVAAFAVAPTIASIVLRETGKPYTYIHDGALMIEWAARKLVAGQNPYVADYLDTPLFYWPMVNNPALYHLTYFPSLFLVTVPFVWVFDHLGLFWDERYLYLPAYVATLAVVPLLVRRTEHRLAATALVALNPQLFPFVVEGRNDFFVLAFLFAGIALLQRERRTLGSLAVAAAAAAKLHAVLILPFVLVWLVATRRPKSARDAAADLAPLVPATIFLAVTFIPFLANDFAAFYDDVVRYNAGGAAWSYPISGMGFSALLLALGVIEYRQADFPFAVIELAVATPVALWWMRRLWRDPTLATMLTGYSLTLLAFLFFGRYFQGNYLGYILAIATPVPFLRRESRRVVRRRRPRVVAPAPGPAPERVVAPVAEPPLAEPTPASVD